MQQVLGEDLVLVRGQQDRMARGADVWGNPVSYDKLGVRYRRWRNSGARLLQPQHGVQWQLLVDLGVAARSCAGNGRQAAVGACRHPTPPRLAVSLEVLTPLLPQCALAVASGDPAARQQAESSLAQPLSAGEVFQPAGEAAAGDVL